MRNPLRSEGEAYRFLIVTIGAFAAIVIASVFGGWKAGLPVFVVVSVAAGWWLMRGEERTPAERVAPATEHERGDRRVLVVASPGIDLGGVRRELERHSGVSQVVVLVPALASPVEQLTGAVDDRRDQAQAAADALASQLTANGASVVGAVGADDPLQAIEDAIRLYGADELVLAGCDADTERAARERFALPIATA